MAGALFYPRKYEPSYPRNFFTHAVFFSFLTHLAVWGAAYAIFQLRRANESLKIELDLTQPYHITGNPLEARISKNPSRVPAAPKRVPPPPPPPVEKAKTEPPKEWFLPDNPSQAAMKPTANEAPETPPSAPSGASGTGTGRNVIYLTRLPKVMNGEELAQLLNDLYPAEERSAGREGTVTLDIHLDEAGRANGADVVFSTSIPFEEAAKNLVGLLKFSPAFAGQKAVPVKVRQTFKFKLKK